MEYQMSSPFIPKLGQRVRVKPVTDEASLTFAVQHLEGMVKELEPETVRRTYPNGGKPVETKYQVPYADRGAYVVFGNLPERYRIPLSELILA
jgi:hypothetical protein